MKLRAVIRVLGFLLGVTAASMLLPAAVSALYRDGDAAGFLLAALAGAAVGAGFWLAGADASGTAVVISPDDAGKCGLRDLHRIPFAQRLGQRRHDRLRRL